MRSVMLIDTNVEDQKLLTGVPPSSCWHGIGATAGRHRPHVTPAGVSGDEVRAATCRTSSSSSSTSSCRALRERLRPCRERNTWKRLVRQSPRSDRRATSLSKCGTPIRVIPMIQRAIRRGPVCRRWLDISRHRYTIAEVETFFHQTGCLPRSSASMNCPRSKIMLPKTIANPEDTHEKYLNRGAALTTAVVNRQCPSRTWMVGQLFIHMPKDVIQRNDAHISSRGRIRRAWNHNHRVLREVSLDDRSHRAAQLLPIIFGPCKDKITDGRQMFQGGLRGTIQHV
mmetsp:Transcript_54177/g.155675  ORF Transcript_54177/g.155675 Transcript_54177/m.155675 type:complete len:284 (-) Transcript_54177:4228-5079(-)